MREFFICLAIIAHTSVIAYIWYNKGYEDAKIDAMSKPSAMDVYQGKTALQYTTVDGEKIDSVVVFKN